MLGFQAGRPDTSVVWFRGLAITVVWVFRPVPTGIPAGTWQSPQLKPKPLHDATMLPHWHMHNQTIYGESFNQLVYFTPSSINWNTQILTTTPSCSWAKLLLGYSQVHSQVQVKLYYSFKQGWREGSIEGENMRFHT